MMLKCIHSKFQMRILKFLLSDCNSLSDFIGIIVPVLL